MWLELSLAMLCVMWSMNDISVLLMEHTAVVTAYWAMQVEDPLTNSG